MAQGYASRGDPVHRDAPGEPIREGSSRAAETDNGRAQDSAGDEPKQTLQERLDDELRDAHYVVPTPEEADILRALGYSATAAIGEDLNSRLPNGPGSYVILICVPRLTKEQAKKIERVERMTLPPNYRSLGELLAWDGRAVDPSDCEAYAKFFLAALDGCTLEFVEEDEGDVEDKAEGKCVPWRRLKLDDVLEQQPPHWTVQGIIRAGQVGLLGAFPTVGKSTIATGMIGSMLYGRPWCGQRVVGGSVIALVGEGRRGFAARIEAERMVARSPWPSNHYFEIVDYREPLSSIEGQARIVELLDDVVADHGHAPAMVVIDTLSSHWNGDEDTQELAAPFMRAMSETAERFGCAILIVHHTAKAKGKFEMPALQDFRGSGAFIGGADVCIGACASKDGAGVRVQVLKAKDDEGGGEWRLRRESVLLGKDDDGTDRSAPRLVPASSANAQREDAIAERELVEAQELMAGRILHEMRELGGKVTNREIVFQRIKGKTDAKRAAWDLLVGQEKILEHGSTRNRVLLLSTHPDCRPGAGSEKTEDCSQRPVRAGGQQSGSPPGVRVRKVTKGEGGAVKTAPSPDSRPEREGGSGAEKGRQSQGVA